MSEKGKESEDDLAVAAAKEWRWVTGWHWSSLECVVCAHESLSAGIERAAPVLKDCFRGEGGREGLLFP